MIKGKWALITGASSGIGISLAEEYARRGVNLVLTARREERLSVLAEKLSKEHHIKTHVIVQDLSKPDAAQSIFENTEQNNIQIDILVNNAGYGLGKKFLDNDWVTISDFLQVMITSITQLTYLYVPKMIERKFGRVLFVSSMAVFMPVTESFGVYNAVKTYMNKFSETIRLATQQFGLHVTVVCPGPTLTEFQKVAGYEEKMKQTLPSYLWMEADEVAKIAVDASEKNKNCVPTGYKNKLLYWLLKIVPASIVRKRV